MPSSASRRRVEIPAELYERLRERAEERQIPVAAYVTWLLIDALEGRDVNRLHPTIEERLDEVLAIVRQMQAQQAQPREFVRLEIPEGSNLLRPAHHEGWTTSERSRLVAELRRPDEEQRP